MWNYAKDGDKLANIWTNDALILFILFFVPGFISLKIYDLLIAKEQRDFSKSCFDAVGYSAVNFAFFIQLLKQLSTHNLL